VLAQRNDNRVSQLFPLGNSLRLDAEITRQGEVAIAHLIAAEAKSECPPAVISNADYLLLELEDLSAGGRICHDSHAVFATGIAATLRLIAMQAAKPAPDLGFIERASWLCADLADMINDELERGVQ